MCGILGQINFNKADLIDKLTLEKMRDTMVHRGPDDQGIFVENNIGLAFRRLSIIDLSKAGSQPMSNEDESVWLVFNGEFYNYLEYRQHLISKGHIFKSNSDTEVIIHLYEEEGIDCLKKINGMFALAIYDKKKGKLFLAVDRLGVKPLHYYSDCKKVIFSSEIKGIVENRGVKRELNTNSLAEYFSFGYILSPNSIFKNINKIKPAYYLEVDIDNGEANEKKYWDLGFKIEKKLNFVEWQEKFDAVFRESIKKRLISDVPLGVFLSGGVDSSSIVTYMSEVSNKKIKTFSIAFREKDFDESEFSRKIARQYDTEHYEEVINPDAIEILPKLTWYYDEPFDDSSAIPTYYVSRMTRGKVKVVLTGDGGDELLAGYPRYRDFNKLNNYIFFLPKNLRSALLNKIQNIYPENLRGKRLLYLLSLPVYQSYQEFMKNNNNMEINNLLSKEIISDYKNTNSFGGIVGDKNMDLITGLQYIDSKTYLPGDILTKVDRASMANSLEARSPFLDYELWQLVFSMPVETRFRGNEGKYIFKEMMKKKLGHDFVYRNKMGFGVPLNHWFRGRLEDYAKSVLLSEKFASRGYFNMNYIKKILAIHQSSKRDFSRKIWSLLFFEHWCRNWLDK